MSYLLTNTGIKRVLTVLRFIFLFLRSMVRATHALTIITKYTLWRPSSSARNETNNFEPREMHC